MELYAQNMTIFTGTALGFCVHSYFDAMHRTCTWAARLNLHICLSVDYVKDHCCA